MPQKKKKIYFLKEKKENLTTEIQFHSESRITDT